MRPSAKVGMLRSRSIVIILAIMWIVLVSAGPLYCTAAAGQSATDIPSTFFGMTLINKSDWPQDSIGALGKGTLVNWSYSEPQRGVFNWANLDAWVETAENHGVDFFFSNNLVPPWAAADQTTCGPTYSGSNVIGCTSTVANIQDWDDFVTALATRYKGKMIYELWNEPNATSFTGTIADMVTLTTHEYNIIRSIDPGALILAPSPTWGTVSPSTYMDQYFGAGGPTGVDVITFHAYWPTPEGIINVINNIQAVMAKYGLSSKPLWDTEGSWNLSLTTDQQIGFVARYYLSQWSMGVSRFYWYAWDDPDWGTLWDPTNGSNPAAIAYQQVYNWMVGAKLSAPCAANGTVWTCGLSRPNGAQALAVWNTAAPSSFSAPAQYTRYQDLVGATHSVSGPATIGPQPVLFTSGLPLPPTNLKATVK